MRPPQIETARRCRTWFTAACLWIVLLLAGSSAGQIRVGSLGSTSPDSVTVQINSGASQSILSLVTGTTNNFSGGPLSITMSWNSLNPGRTAVALYGYFNSATSALVHSTAGNTVDIPSAAVKVRVDGVGSYNPFSSVVPYTGSASGRLLINQAISGANKTGSRTDTFDLQIDLSGIVNGQDMRQLPPDTYTGTLRIQAQAFP